MFFHPFCKVDLFFSEDLVASLQEQIRKLEEEGTNFRDQVSILLLFSESSPNLRLVVFIYLVWWISILGTFVAVKFIIILFFWKVYDGKSYFYTFILLILHILLELQIRRNRIDFEEQKADYEAKIDGMKK